MTKRIFFLLILSISLCHNMLAQDDDTPMINPTATYTNYKGETETSTNYSDNAPLTGVFVANPTNTDGWNCYYEWRFTRENETEPYLIRYEEDTEYVFKEAGTHLIMLYATFTKGSKTIEYTDEYWGQEMSPLSVTISESKLIMPNAFSPNHDQRNDTYKVKEYQSLIEFHATIYNRWGQKLYEWDDPAAEGWDGTFHGKDVKQGVYFVEVVAKGADGRTYHVRSDVNLLRGYTESTKTSTGGE